jgi:HK97 family phage major capsid protein
MTTKQLKEKRASLVAEMRDILNIASKENRELSNEESAKYDRIEADEVRLSNDIDRVEKLEKREAELAGALGQIAERHGKKVDEVEEMKIKYNSAYRNYLIKGKEGLSNEERDILNTRAQAKGTPNKGGYLVPETLQVELDIALKAFGGVRALARVMNTASGEKVNLPTLNNSSTKATIIAENTQSTASDLTFGNVEIDAFTYRTSIIPVSYELLQDSVFNVAQIIRDAVAEQIARGTNEHFTVGNGSSQPHGVVTAATAATPTAGAAAITFDNMIDLEHSVDPLYRRNGAFMFNDSTLKALKKLKDQDQQYIWQPAVASNSPSTILGYRYEVNQDMASIGASARSVLFGDFSKFIVRDVQGTTILRMGERYADFLQVAFLGFSRHDSALVDAGTNPIKALVHAAG